VQLIGLGLTLPLDLANVLDPLAHPDVFSVGHAFTGWLLEATALAAVAVAVGETGAERGPWLPVAVLALATMVPRASLIELVSTPAASACAIWLVVAALRRQVSRSTGERLFASLAAFTFLESVTLGQLLRLMGVDVHLHDTYFVVGMFHLRATTCVLAALAVALRHCAAAEPKSLLYLATALCAIGSQLMCFAMTVVGTRGMPRRYFNYLPEFQSLHRVIAVGGGLLMLGVGVVLVELWRPKYPATADVSR
jgi:heme/copper-type cytochrome/quinol oxidase subunit 1